MEMSATHLFKKVAILATFAVLASSACAQGQSSTNGTPLPPDSGKAKAQPVFVVAGLGMGSVASEFGFGFSISFLHNSDEFELRAIHTMPDNASYSSSGGLLSPTNSFTSYPTQQLDEITLLYGSTLRAATINITLSGGLSWASGTFRGDHLKDEVTQTTSYWTDIYGNRVAYLDGGTDTKKYYQEITIPSVGYTAQMKLRFALGKITNLGVTGFVTYHPEKTYFGALVSVEFGSVPYAP